MSTRNLFNYSVYSFCVGWWNAQQANPLEFIAKSLAVEDENGTYKRYPQGYVFRPVDTLRPEFGEARSISTGAIDEPFLLEDHSIKLPVSDRSVRNAANKKEAADQKAIAGMGTLLGTWRTSMQYDGFNYFRSLVSAETGKGNWTSADSEPIAELLGLVQKFRLANGVAPNRILMSDEAWTMLGANPSVKDLVAFNAAKKLTPELLLALLDLSGNTGAAPVQLMHATVPVGTAAPGPGVQFEGTNLLGTDVWLAYKDDDNQIGNMSGLAILHTGEDNAIYAANTESYYERKIKTTFYEVEMMRKFVTPAPSCAMRLTVS